MLYRIATLSSVGPSQVVNASALAGRVKTCAALSELFSEVGGTRVDAGLVELGSPATDRCHALLHTLGEFRAALADMGQALQPIFVVGPVDTGTMAQALAAGATDYLSCQPGDDPLSAPLRRIHDYLQARVRMPLLKVGGCELKTEASTLCYGALELPLTPRELALATLLFAHPGKVIPAETFAMRVWGRSSEVCRRSLEQHMYRLRGKVEQAGLRIRTVYRIGYQIEAVVSSRA